MNKNPDDSIKYIEELIMLAKKLGIPYDASAIDLFIQSKSEELSKEDSFQRVKNKLIQKRFLLPVNALVKEGFSIYVYNYLEKPSAFDDTLDKMLFLLFTSFYAGKNINMVSLNDAPLKIILKNENLSPFDKALFIFKDDYDELSQEQKKKLIEVDPALAVQYLDQNNN